MKLSAIKTKISETFSGILTKVSDLYNRIRAAVSSCFASLSFRASKPRPLTPERVTLTPMGEVETIAARNAVAAPITLE